MAAGVIRAMGVDMGAKAGLNHEDPQFLTDDEDKLRARIKARNASSAVWGFKVPKASLKLDFFEAHLRNPYYIVVYRNILSVIDSWQQRGAGQPLDVMEHILNYYSAISVHCRRTKSPVLLLNYERSVATEEARTMTVVNIAEMLGVELSSETLRRAKGMMTGDGSGYVNLPEHFFTVTPYVFPKSAPENDLEIEEITPELRVEGGWVEHKNAQPMISYRMANGENLPKRFRLDIDFDSSMQIKDSPLRIYFNFTGEYFPGHCARPPVKKGKNSYIVETSGFAKALGFGPLNYPARLNVRARMFRLEGRETADADTPSKILRNDNGLSEIRHSRARTLIREISRRIKSNAG